MAEAMLMPRREQARFHINFAVQSQANLSVRLGYDHSYDV